jgi:replicative DNA helicase
MNNKNQLPCDLNAESFILSAILQSSDNEKPFAQLRELDFYKNTHKIIFRAMAKLYNSNTAIDLVTLSGELKKNDQMDKVGGINFLNNLSELVMSDSNIGEYIRIVKEKSTLRNLILSMMTNLDKAFSPDAISHDIKSSLEGEISSITDSEESKNKFIHIGEGIVGVIAEIDNTKQNFIHDYINTGFEELDQVLGNIRPGQLILLAARTSMGKSMLGLNIAFNAAVCQKKVGVFTMEMKFNELMIRQLSSMTSIPSKAISTGRIDDREASKIMAAGNFLTGLQIYINDYPDQNKRTFEFQSRKLKEKLKGLDLLVIDYLQLSSGEGKDQNRLVIVSELSRALKNLASSLNVSIIALSQLNRNLEMRSNKEPMLSDLRESGSLEQDADSVIFIHNEYEYDKSKDPNNVKIIVAKNRHGKKGVCELRIDPEISLFSNKPQDQISYFNEKKETEE